MSNADQKVPAICEKCLGSNPYLKMIREPQGDQCRICTSTYNLFKWNANKGSKLSRTLVCLECARQRNCCQSCMFDLTYHIPMSLRDAAFKIAGMGNFHEVLDSPNAVTKRFNAQKQQQKYLEGGQPDQQLLTDGEPEVSEAQARKTLDEILQKLVQSRQASDNSKFNPKKENSHGAESSNNNLKNTDIAKILTKLPFNGNLTLPKNTSITSFFIFGINNEISNGMVAEYIEQKLAEVSENKEIKLKSIILNHRAKCGFICFEKRKVAEKLSNLVDKPRGTKGPGIMFIKNIPIRITWCKVKSLGCSSSEEIKLGYVVRRQMKLLAEKDHKAIGKKANNGDSSSNMETFEPPGPPGSKSNYSSQNGNFES
ncbi:Ecm2 protein [Saccharomycopsis crataegensis]|uniref:Pre-mRNA-splicing factor SLT11 n=1 Tax=Saccharomycopsis crataegensis TaxID=43959 RepID=A0AAV5QI05_9ASCO|nr:Ecm2 protein [Saccharomycopsis crataegensis]